MVQTSPVSATEEERIYELMNLCYCLYMYAFHAAHGDNVCMLSFEEGLM